MLFRFPVITDPVTSAGNTVSLITPLSLFAYPLSPNEWDVIIATVSSSETNIYLNGELVNTVAGPFTIPSLNATSYYIGREASVGRFPKNQVACLGIANEVFNSVMVENVTNSCWLNY